DVLCTVNVQHNCAAHGCSGDGQTAVYQERERAAHGRASVLHRERADVVLNTFQMRNAVNLQ
ncbi:hypothetical protein FKP32DRAFT_1557913, partial [Trametes sanguinea]